MDGKLKAQDAETVADALRDWSKGQIKVSDSHGVVI
jgi:hypothetical protein